MQEGVQPAPKAEMAATLDPLVSSYLSEVLDPEIGLNIVDLGLVVVAERTAEAVTVRLTLTSRACPLGDMVLNDVCAALASAFPGLRLDVQLVWEPMWSPDFISDRGYELLGRPRARTLI
jgi:metal-sulfur cluster biosynthetic enzyme